jgi:N-glycosylase/DNA lyase|tara:strand:+ start:2030 stop:2263 length:234 start_codon:yes stop_codon:yes gene_type:complete
MSGHFLKVEGVPGLVRDTVSGALINVNHAEIELAQERKRLRNIKRQEEANIRDSVTSLQKDMEEIKEALNLLLSRSV